MSFLEEYFAKYGTKPDDFFSRYKNGEADAKKAFSYVGLLPINASNVWAEMRFADHMIASAQNPNDRIGHMIPVVVDETVVGADVVQMDTVLPPYDVQQTEHMVRDLWQRVEFIIKNPHHLDPSLKIPEVGSGSMH